MGITGWPHIHRCHTVDKNPYSSWSRGDPGKNPHYILIDVRKRLNWEVFRGIGTCSKKRLNGGPLDETVCHRKIKLSPCSKAISDEHGSKFCSAWHLYEWNILEWSSKRYPINQSINQSILLFVPWGFTSNSRIFHSFWDATITGEKLQILSNTRYSLPLSCEVSLTCHTYCVAGHPVIMIISQTRDLPVAERLAVGLSLPVLTTYVWSDQGSNTYLPHGANALPLT